MLLLNANLKVVNLYAITKITQLIFCSSYIHMYFILIRIETLQKMRPNILISLLDRLTFY